MKYYRKQPVEAIQWDGCNQKEVYQLASKAVEDCYTADDAYSNLHVAYWDKKGSKRLATIPKLGWVVIEGKTLQFYKDETFRKTFKPAEEVEDESAGIDWEAMDKNIKDFFETFDKDKLFRGFHGIPKENIQDYVNKKASKDEGLKEILDKSFEDMAHKKWVIDYFVAPAIPVRKDFADYIKKKPHEDEEASKDDAIKWREEFLKQLHENIEHIIKETRNGGFLYSSSKEDVHAVTGESLCKSSDKETFDSVIDEMKELHAKKNKDYKGSFHDLFKEYGMPYALGHLEEKLNRVKAITANGGNAVKNDHIEDSVIDLASYAVMLYVELKNKENG